MPHTKFQLNPTSGSGEEVENAEKSNGRRTQDAGRTRDGRRTDAGRTQDNAWRHKLSWTDKGIIKINK